ncbi:MAG: thiamine pyrophosphate-binding protein [Rickettsiales bacterium]
MKYSDFLCEILRETGYTHCFSVGGGNIMHLTESASRYFQVIPVVHEVACGIACEYFNALQDKQKAFALVTAGPGLSNIVTAIAGAYFESRELLVIGGQVKTSDLSYGKVRQKGIQEIDGVEIVKSITKYAIRLDNLINKESFLNILKIAENPRKGPIFIEIPLDIQAKTIKNEDNLQKLQFVNSELKFASSLQIKQIATKVKNAQRPVFLLGGGINKFGVMPEVLKNLANDSVVIQTSWNGIDLIDSSHPLFFGRPDNWGQRYANILLQQADLLVAFGSKLGMQQTGFNYQEFVPNGEIIQIDCDENELNKGHPKIFIGLNCDANDLLMKLSKEDLGSHQNWIDFCRDVKALLPLNEACNSNAKDFISPYNFSLILATLCNNNDIIIPCSSGGASTVLMQSFNQKFGQKILNNKALASMGYGLSGAIGASIANPDKRTILIEGDGGFSQNLQEIATASTNNLNLKIFIFENSGYASIRMTQKNYFNGKYVGCDINTGLGFPNWFKLFEAYEVEALEIKNEDFVNDKKFIELFNNKKCVAFIVKIDPEQTYFPKISSRVKNDGSMESNPLHLMTPELEPDLAKKVLKYIET